MYATAIHCVSAGQSLYQLFIIFFLIFYGDVLFDIESGRNRDFRDSPTQHFTIVFNACVWMQVSLLVFVYCLLDLLMFFETS